MLLQHLLIACPRDFPTTKVVILEDQLQNYIIDVRSDNMFVALTSIGDLSKNMVIIAKDKVYPLVYWLLSLALILPVTTELPQSRLRTPFILGEPP